MAEVFLAVTGSAAMAFSKLVVVKKPREHLADDLDFMTMLVDEGRIATRLNHPNLVQTLEVGEVNGQYFLTMEYLDGQPLHRILSRARATINGEMLISILADVLGGVHYAHDLKDYDGTPLQIVHRDVTPHNVFITYEGQVKVVDFGIAKAVGRASETRHGVVKGKTAYMAPEQACGQTVDRRVDVFAVGVMLFEAAARARMWKGVSETDIIRRLVSGDIPSSPKAVNPAVDDELDRICRRALAFSPEDRYPTAAAFQTELEDYLATKSGRPSARALGLYVAELFADKRATTDKIIGTQLSHLRTDSRVSVAGMPASSSENSFSLQTAPSSSPGVTAVMPPGTKTSPSGNAQAQSFPPVDDNVQKTLLMVRSNGGAVSAPPPSAPTAVVTATATGANPIQSVMGVLRSSTKGLVPLIIAAVVLTFATAALTIFAFAPQSTQGSGDGTGATKGKMISITLKATPLETRFSIDNGSLLDNPYIGTFEGDGKEHIIRAQAPGYPPTQETVRFDNDLSLRFTLSARRQQ